MAAFKTHYWMSSFRAKWNKVENRQLENQLSFKHNMANQKSFAGNNVFMKQYPKSFVTGCCINDWPVIKITKNASFTEMPSNKLWKHFLSQFFSSIINQHLHCQENSISTLNEASQTTKDAFKWKRGKNKKNVVNRVPKNCRLFGGVRRRRSPINLKWSGMR